MFKEYNNTTGNGANIFIASDGQFLRSTSSQRYKNTINDATHGLTELLTLRPVTYKGNNDGDITFGGLIAEEVHDAGLTEFVEYNENGGLNGWPHEQDVDEFADDTEHYDDNDNVLNSNCVDDVVSSSFERAVGEMMISNTATSGY